MLKDEFSAGSTKKLKLKLSSSVRLMDENYPITCSRLSALVGDGFEFISMMENPPSFTGIFIFVTVE